MDSVDTREEGGGSVCVCVCARAGTADEGRIDEKWFKSLVEKDQTRPNEVKRDEANGGTSAAANRRAQHPRLPIRRGTLTVDRGSKSGLASRSGMGWGWPVKLGGWPARYPGPLIHCSRTTLLNLAAFLLQESPRLHPISLCTCRWEPPVACRFKCGCNCRCGW